MGWSTKDAIGGNLHGCHIIRHHSHHSPSIYSYSEQDWSILQHFVRLYGFEGEAGWEGAGRTRIRESSYRRTHNQGQNEMDQGQNEIHEIRIHHLGALNEANMKVHALRGAEGDVAT